MITYKSTFGFRSATVTLSDSDLVIMAEAKKFSAITGISYAKLSLPGFRVKEKPTSLIDLTLPEAEMFHRCSDTTRNEINRAQRNSDLAFVIPDSQFEASYDVYRQFELSQNRVPFVKLAMKQFTICSAYYRGELISGVYVATCAPYLRIRSIFSKRLSVEDKEMQKIISNATRGLIWQLCLWGKKQGFVSLDLASVNNTTPKSAAIAKFKLSFGGPVVPEYTYIYESLWFRMFARMIPFVQGIQKKLRFFN